ncbi:MMPL family transporter [Motiliproteus sp. MSK22-1]|uniref:MMPL family transporter n=1 Tax=Motiliproteus sp. MSK22-1 TaxID=1897630 RepID=UPI000976FE22|nr:hypothetical protein [Motiliproteus sp. MSK22-1]OMH31682.1 hypothetical protein BGP75_16280 [Motiliproteus sp. MSK22-1]
MKERISSHRWAATSWILLVIIVVFLAFRQGPAFDSSILALLPESEQQPVIQRAIDQMAERFSKRIILLVSAKNEETARTAIKSLAESLIVLPDISEVTWQINESETSKYQDELYPFRFSVIDETTRKLLLTEDYIQIKQRALHRLYSPISVGGSSIIEDPFGFFNELSLQRFSNLDLQVSDSLLKVVGAEQPSYMLIAALASDPFAPDVQHRVLETIAIQKHQLDKTAVSIDMSGMLLHAAAGANQASKEISTIGLGSLLGIIIAILCVFRRFKPLMLLLFTVSIGCISAAAVTMLVFDRVHLVTFAFGAGLVGVSIDYALHFLTERSVSPHNQIMRRLLPGLMLGLFSSVVAYAAQALAPFPGLRQMAVFSVVGLSASWLTVVLCLPLLTKQDPLKPLKAALTLDRLRKRIPRVEGNPLLMLLLLASSGIAIQALWNSSSLDDIRLLQTSPANLLAQEKRIQQALKTSSSSQFILITADSLEHCLQKEEQISIELNRLKENGQLNDYQALSQVLPSLQRQTENTILARQLYDQQLKPLYTIFNVSDKGLDTARLNFEQDVEQQLTPEVWQQHRGAKNWKDLIVLQSETSAATVIRFSGDLSHETKEQLVSLTDVDPEIFYVDQVQNISDLMGNYRGQILTWVIIAYLCVLLVLSLRYKTQVWRIVMPPFLASIFSLAILLQLEQGINLFHLMALILVLGIGLDMGIFLFETDEAAHTWLAVSLSTYTSLLAFGLLALSDTPVLHHFGLTVLLGLVFVWLLTPTARKNNRTDSQI